MRDKKFTPGPWEWNGAAGVTNSRFEYPDNEDLVRVCDVWNNRAGMDHPDHLVKANANLIAAAPELLEALERLMVGFVPQEHNDLGIIADCERAIAKAYGE